MSKSHSAPDPAELQRQVDQLNSELTKVRGFMQGMQDLSDSLQPTTQVAELHELLSEVLRTACQTIGARDASLLVLDDETKELVFILTRGDVPPEKLAWRRIPANEGIAGWVVKNQRATVVNNAQADERFYGQLDNELEFRTRSILAAPIIGDTKVLGVIEILNKVDGELFNLNDQMMLSLLCRFAGELLHTLTRRTLQNTRVRVPKLRPI
jgi:GAF domain-containing protein